MFNICNPNAPLHLSTYNDFYKGLFTLFTQLQSLINELDGNDDEICFYFINLCKLMNSFNDQTMNRQIMMHSIITLQEMVVYRQTPNNNYSTYKSTFGLNNKIINIYNDRNKTINQRIISTYGNDIIKSVIEFLDSVIIGYKLFFRGAGVSDIIALSFKLIAFFIATMCVASIVNRLKHKL